MSRLEAPYALAQRRPTKPGNVNLPMLLADDRQGAHSAQFSDLSSPVVFARKCLLWIAKNVRACGRMYIDMICMD